MTVIGNSPPRPLRPLPEAGKIMSNIQRRVSWFAMLVLLAGLTGSTLAQTRVADCKVGSRATATGFWTWQPETQVNVYVLQSDFSKEEISSLKTPIELWDAVSEATESKVSLTYAGATQTPLECENCLTIRRGNVHNEKTRHASEIRAFGINRSEERRVGKECRSRRSPDH